MKKCMYCNIELGDEEIVDVCTPCGFGVWGKPMFNAIKENMSKAKDAGDLHQGSITEGM